MMNNNLVCCSMTGHQLIKFIQSNINLLSIAPIYETNHYTDKENGKSEPNI